MKTAAALIAGGRSRRMGSDKALLDWEGRTLLQHQGDTLRRCRADERLLACRSDQRLALPGFRIVVDRQHDTGPLGALAGVWSETDAEVLVVLAIDMPLVDPAWLDRCAGLAERTSRTCMTRIGGRFEPLACAWHRSAASAMDAAAAEADRSFQQLCRNLEMSDRLHVVPVDPDREIEFRNLNTPDSHAKLLAARHAHGSSCDSTGQPAAGRAPVNGN